MHAHLDHTHSINFETTNNTLFLVFDIYTKHDNNQNNFKTTYLQGNLLLHYNKVKKIMEPQKANLKVHCNYVRQ